MKETLVVIACFILSSCASQSLVTSGSIMGNDYITAGGLIALSAPPGWQWSTEISSRDVTKLASKLKRPREIILLFRANRETFMLIETYRLTWGGKHITPAVLTSTIPQERIESVCNFFMQSETSSKFSSNVYKCLTHEKNSECLPETPCLESTRERISTRPKNSFVYDRVYMIGVPSQKTISGNDEGWKMSFTLFTPKETAEENKIVLDSVLNSIRLIN